MRMVSVLCGMVVLATAALSAAAPKSVDEGHWINLFDGETTYGWTNMGDVEWSAKDGALTSGKGTGGMLATTSQFRDFELTAKIRVKPGTTTGMVFRAGLEGHPTANGSSIVWIREEKGADAQWRDVHVVARGDDISIDVSGRGVRTEKGTRGTGHIGILYHHNGGSVVEVKDIKLRPLTLSPLFNGKNLKGWNVIPNHDSVFTVVDGSINIKHGNGQIETEGVYENFLLQLDIKSNGEHLNSGVFFRSPPEKFWKGYESQVRNQWVKDDRTRPVDYGTGGNYGNQAARKVVSSDHEWFEKTVVVTDNRFAVWIDGYQVSDFLDTRYINKGFNAKEGFVPWAGTINLQGHDPTTDLLFKNINIQEY
jgi:3-keto-disaccharide hydrolase